MLARFCQTPNGARIVQGATQEIVVRSFVTWPFWLLKTTLRLPYPSLQPIEWLGEICGTCFRQGAQPTAFCKAGRLETSLSDSLALDWPPAFLEPMQLRLDRRTLPDNRQDFVPMHVHSQQNRPQASQAPVFRSRFSHDTRWTIRSGTCQGMRRFGDSLVLRVELAMEGSSCRSTKAP